MQIKPNKYIVLLVSFSVLLLLTSTTQAEPTNVIVDLVRLSDCRGNIIAKQSSKNTHMSLLIVSDRLNQKPEIVNLASGELIYSKKNKEGYKLKRISSGNWKLCNKDGTQVAFSKLSFDTSGQDKTSTILTSLGLLGGGILVASTNNGSSSDNTVNSVQNTLSQQSTNNNTDTSNSLTSGSSDKKIGANKTDLDLDTEELDLCNDKQVSTLVKSELGCKGEPESIPDSFFR